MADNYTDFSAEIEGLTDKEAKWCENELKKLADGDGVLSFEWKILTDPNVKLWIYTVDTGNVEQVAYFAQQFLKTHRPHSFFAFTYAETCNKPRINEFGGGAVFVTAKNVTHFDAHGWLDKRKKRFWSGGKNHE